MGVTPQVALADVLHTSELSNRKNRAIDFAVESQALTEIARAMSGSPRDVIELICEKALALCNAGSSGVSVLFEDDGGGFSWEALAGVFAPFTGGVAPREHSPCGVCLALDAPQLFVQPERYFEWLQEPNIPVYEGLVIPLYGEGRRHYGTIWVMSHEPGQQFDLEDVRIMTALGEHMSTALRMLGWFGDEPSALHLQATTPPPRSPRAH